MKVPSDKKPEMPDPLEALDALARSNPSRAHMMDFSHELTGQNSDRGFAILLATVVENSLDRALVQFMALKPSRQRELFRSGAPLGDLYSKMLIGHSIGLYGKQMRRNLDLIRGIRNAFAHSKVSISFKTMEVIDVCALLRVPAIVPPRTEMSIERATDSKSVYRNVCDYSAHNLLWWHLTPPASIEPSELVSPLVEGYRAVAIREPLP